MQDEKAYIIIIIEKAYIIIIIIICLWPGP